MNQALTPVSTSGVVYVLVNEAMPGLVKIGMTSDLRRRLTDLDTTSVPLPFDVHHASRVENMRRAEALLHRAFADRRVRPNREFFRVDPDQAAAALRLAEVEDVTNEAQAQVMSSLTDPVDRDALRRTRSKVASFEGLGIPVGTEIVYLRRPGIVARVSGARLVEYEGSEWSLSALSRDLISKLEGKDWPSANGWAYWLLEGRLLSDIWNERMAERDTQSLTSQPAPSLEQAPLQDASQAFVQTPATSLPVASQDASTLAE